MTVVSGRGAHVLLDTCPERLLLEAVMSLRAILFFLKKVMQELVRLLKVSEVLFLSSSLTRTQTTMPQIRACSAH